MTNGEKIKELFPHFDVEDKTEYFGRIRNLDDHFIKADIDFWNAEYKEPTTKNDLVVDKEQLKTMIRGLTKWYVKIGSTAVGAPNTAVGLLYDDVMFGIDRLPSVTPQEPRKGHWIEYSWNDNGLARWGLECDKCHKKYKYGGEIWNNPNYCPNRGADMREVEE